VVLVAAWRVLPRALKERRFRAYQLDGSLLADAGLRARLEAMTPEQVGRYLECATDAAVVDYLQRLLEFSREQAALAAAPAGAREGVTFIMGEDRNQANRFYQAATDYYATDSGARTEHLERNLRCLADVREYLQNYRPAGGPWGIVNIVAHSYEWGGLSVPVREGEGRTDLTSLKLAMASGELKPLADSVVDCRTEIRIQGCALGRDTALLRLMSVAFGGRDIERPRVGSSRYFVYYESRRAGGLVASAGQFFAQYWYVVYPKGQRPNNTELAKRFAERYPEVRTDWRSALGRSGPRWPGDAFYRMLSLPATWVTVYPDSVTLPRVTTTAARRAWLETQTELGQRLSGLGLGLDDFAWSARDTAVVDSGVVKPAIIAVGRGTIACIERDVVMPDALPWFVRRVYGSALRPQFWQEDAPARPPAQPPGFNVAVR
jgi:hypothetical protein